MSILIAFADSAYAQADEIIVMARRVENSPGVFLEKRGDFLLLTATLVNDTRDVGTRFSELNQTINKIITSASRDADISLNVVDDNDFVRPLTTDNFQAGIRSGRRPDTSIVTIYVKTAIPSNAQQAFGLSAKMGSFIEKIKGVGRTEIDTNDDVTVSVVNPQQHRRALLAQILEEIKYVTQSLGPDYRAKITGLDREIKWSRSGELGLAFYLPYRYEILPTSLNATIEN